MKDQRPKYSQDSRDNSFSDQTKIHLEGQEHRYQLQDQGDAFPGHVHILYAYETWTLTADIERRMQEIEMKCFRKLLGVSYRNHITNKEVKTRIENTIGPYEDITSAKKTQTEVVRARHTIIWTG